MDTCDWKSGSNFQILYIYSIYKSFFFKPFFIIGFFFLCCVVVWNDDDDDDDSIAFMLPVTKPLSVGTKEEIG